MKCGLNFDMENRPLDDGGVEYRGKSEPLDPERSVIKDEYGNVIGMVTATHVEEAEKRPNQDPRVQDD